MRACLRDMGQSPPAEHAHASSGARPSRNNGGPSNNSNHSSRYDDWEDYLDDFDEAGLYGDESNGSLKSGDNGLRIEHQHEHDEHEHVAEGGGGSGGWRKALEIFDTMTTHEEGKLADADANVDAHADADADADAERDAEAHEGDHAFTRLAPRAGTFNSAIEAARRGHEWERVLELARRMQRARKRPSADTYKGILVACERLEKWKDALDFLADMPKRGELPNSRDEVSTSMQPPPDPQHLSSQLPNPKDFNPTTPNSTRRPCTSAPYPRPTTPRSAHV